MKAEAAHGALEPFAHPIEGSKWSVRYVRAGHAVLEVDVDVSPPPHVEAVWRGAKVDFPMARGYPGWFGSHVSAWWFWLPLCVTFLRLFADPRRPLQIGHLDLLMIVAGFGLSQYFFGRGQIGLSVPLAYIPLVYLLTRTAAIGLGRAPAGVLSTRLSTRWLAVLLVLLCAARITLNVADHNDHDYVGWGRLGSTVTDVGLAGVAGADRIEHGHEIYVPGATLDTYGPLNYLAYVPFELVWPYHAKWDALPAAHAAAITFDLLTLLGLFVLGTRLRRGPPGRRLGLVLACAWAACPYTAYVLNANSNDALVAAAVVWAVVAFRSAFLRGVVIGIGAAVKFVPAVLAAPLLRFRSERAPRAPLLVAAGALVVVAVTLWPLVPPQGIGLVWHHTVAHQAGWFSPFSVWGMWDWLRWLRVPLEVVVVLAALAVALRPRDDVVQAAALGAALILGIEVTSYHWIYFYVVWFLPLLLVSLLVRREQ